MGDTTDYQVLRDHLAPVEEELLHLPPSEVLKLALADVRKTIRTKTVDGMVGVVRMDDWVEFRDPDGDIYVIPADDNAVCCVCLGGAVVANRLPLNELRQRLSRVLTPSDFGEDLRQLIRMLNDFRLGRITGGLVSRYIGELSESFYEDYAQLIREKDPDLDTDYFQDVSREGWCLNVADYDHEASEEANEPFFRDMQLIVDFLARNNL